jgi:hypothetical protein
MQALIYAAMCCLGLGGIATVCAAMSAPKGYEDEEGFHKCRTSAAVESDSFDNHPSILSPPAAPISDK